MKHYSYNILRYSHDPISGEIINVGLLLYSKEEAYAELRLNENYGYLAQLYRGFCKEDFEMKLRSLNAQVRGFKRLLKQPSLIESLPPTSVELGKRILPDQGGAFRFGPLGRGRGFDLNIELELLFDQLVADQRIEKHQSERRDNRTVWQRYRKSLEDYGVTRVLEEHKVITPSVKLDFDHTYQNGHRNALEPLSLDYIDADSINSQAAKWVGYSSALKKSSGFGKLYLLLGKPNPAATYYTPEHQEAYIRALNLLKDMSDDHEVVQEEESEVFAKKLADKMKKEGVLK